MHYRAFQPRAFDHKCLQLQDLWQGIDFSRSKAEARVDVSLFSLLSLQLYLNLKFHGKFV